MPKNDIGGFFVSLGLNPDKNSFETGNKLIDNVATSLNKLIGTARNAAVALTTTAVVTGTVESANYKTATAIGLSTEKLNTWKAAAKIAGVNADGLVGSMGKLSDVMTNLKINGEGAEAYQKVLAELGIGLDQLTGKDIDDAYLTILEKAQSMLDGTNMTEIAKRVQDVLGEQGMNLFIELDRQGLTPREFLAGAKATQFTTDADNQKGQNFITEIRTLTEETKSITALLGNSIAGILVDKVKSINEWIQNNADVIKDAVVKITGAVDNIAQGIILITGKIAEWSTSEKGKTQISGIIGTFKNAFTTSKNLASDIWTGNWEKAYYDYIEGFENMWDSGKKILGIQDGIMRPDGTITQVAPDDWVFAARNVGDLARAFVPQGTGSGMQIAEYSIVQNFTINGGSDMPQVIRQQAYQGTQQGLLEAMARSSDRLQLMSGTR